MRNDAIWKTADLSLERGGGRTLVDQIARYIETAILEGALPAGTRLPSWRDLAGQLSIARGTVRAAYEKLIDRGLLIAAGSAGTRVADPLPIAFKPVSVAENLLPEDFQYRRTKAAAFQMGVPAHDAFPATLWTRLHRQAVQATSLQTGYSDPRGLPELRSAIASHVAMARGIECSPEQVIVTTGFRNGLGLALRAIGATGKQAWVEDPGYPVTRYALELSGVHPIAVPVDGDGLIVESGRKLAPNAPSLSSRRDSRHRPVLRWLTIVASNCWNGLSHPMHGSSKTTTLLNCICSVGR